MRKRESKGFEAFGSILKPPSPPSSDGYGNVAHSPVNRVLTPILRANPRRLRSGPWVDMGKTNSSAIDKPEHTVRDKNGYKIPRERQFLSNPRRQEAMITQEGKCQKNKIEVR